MDEAIARARDQAPFSLVLVLCYAAGFHLSRSDRAPRAPAPKSRGAGDGATLRRARGVRRADARAAIDAPKPRLDAARGAGALPRARPRRGPRWRGRGHGALRRGAGELGARDPALEQIERAFARRAAASATSSRRSTGCVPRLRPTPRARSSSRPRWRARASSARRGELFAALDLARAQHGSARQAAALDQLRAATAPFAPDCGLRELREARELVA
jgi:hypothetical protein